MSDLIIINDKEIQTDIVSYEISKGMYEDADIVAIFKTKAHVDYHVDQGDFIEDALSKVRDLLRENTTSDFDPISRNSIELSLQDTLLKYFRAGGSELEIARLALTLYIINCVSPNEKNTTVANINNIVSDENKKHPSSKGIVVSDNLEYSLIDAISLKELQDMRLLKGLNVLPELDPTQHISSDEINISTKYFNGVNNTNLEAAVRELISLEVLKSKQKLLYIIKEPKIQFALNEPNKFKLFEKIVNVSEKIVNEQSKV
jgi:hypothetical protein